MPEKFENFNPLNPESEQPELENFGKEDEEKAKESFGKIFDAHQTGQERAEALMSKIDPFLASGLVDREMVLKQVATCATAETRDDFITRVAILARLFIELRERNPEEFARLREQSREKFIDLNEALSYQEGTDEQGKKLYHLHLVPKEKLGPVKLEILVREGLCILAKMTKDNEEVTKIEATSWIVAKHPKLMEHLGFTVTGAISEELRQAHFNNEKRKVFHAEISRNDFIKKYLK